MKTGKKANKLFDSEQNRVVVIVLEVAVLLTMVVVTCAILRSDILVTLQEPSVYVLQSNLDNSEYETERSGSGYGFGFNESTQYTEGNALVPNAGDRVNSSYKPQKNNLPDPAKWTEKDIIEKAVSAVNKTKGYKNNLSVHHKESFEATVTECSGGSLVQKVVNRMVGLVVKPVDETLNFKNGYAQNSEGETVPIILPKTGAVKLSPEGVTKASARVSGGEYIINISLVSESVGIGETPIHNAGAIGFLDVANFDISFMTVDRADISYTGSSIELHINDEGYVTYAVYKVPLEIDGAAHRGSVSGSAVFVGEQVEFWTLNY